MTSSSNLLATRIAVVADVHGNLPALEAVVADIARRSVDLVLNLGDHASGPLWPRETVAFLERQSWLHIAGNCDRLLVRQPPADHGASERFAYERLAPEQLRWLSSLPATASAEGDVLAFHGTPSDDCACLLETIEHGRGRLASRAEIAERLGGASASVMLCAHTHTPRIVRLDGTLIVNPGSIGLPAYDGDDPEPHVMETGSPDARYAMLERDDHGWRAELVAVAYDHRAAAERARENGRPEWALALRTGFMTA
ncbi:MAG TPA: metallophosphoesterase family protein [Gemmatimonadaceae bacterium]|nr:metallophosphoesterase family protein [Gemmatimonadaceae bacterium]